jgi:hypothetical protein
MQDGDTGRWTIAAGFAALAAVLLLEGIGIAGNRSAVTYREPSTAMMSLQFRPTNPGPGL